MNRHLRTPLGMGILETAVMRALWDAPDWYALQDIQAALKYPHTPHRSTLATVVLNLYGKDMISRKAAEQGSGWWYRAVPDEAEYIGNMIAALLACATRPDEALAIAERARQESG